MAWRPATMATVLNPLIWEIVRNNNSFLVKKFGNGHVKVQFSKEKNNLYNIHSFKYSGLANIKTISIYPEGKDLNVVLAMSKKQQNKPVKRLLGGAGRRPCLERLRPLLCGDVVVPTEMEAPGRFILREIDFLAPSRIAPSKMNENSLSDIF